MKWTLFVSGIWLVLACAQPVNAQQRLADSGPRIMERVGRDATLLSVAETRPALRQVLDDLVLRAKMAGEVRAVVKMAVPFAPENLLSAAQTFAQRAEIAQATRRLQMALPGTADVVPMAGMPYVAMSLGVDDLAALGTVPGVVGIFPAETFNWRRDYIRLRVNPQAGVLPAGASAGGSRVVPKIVGGKDADPTTHPFQVGLLDRGTSDTFKAQFCGGTLVANKFVVTAAHCSDTISNAPNEVQVLVGTQKLDGSGQRINVSKVTVHPNWNSNSNSNDYDVAVWELASSVTGIPFATLASTQPTVAGTLLRVTGWGSLSYQGSYPIMMGEVDVPFVPAVNDNCQDQSGITARMLCAGSSGKDSCQGDSGGPLTMDTGSGYNVLAGIVSFGTGCGWADYPGVYAKVADTSVRAFITNVMASTQAPSKTIQFQTVARSVSEGGRTVMLTLQRSSGTGTASVRFATENGSALSGNDYRASSGTVNFRSGRTTATFSLSIVNDRVRESSEQFTVRLSSPSSGWELGNDNVATVTITDND